MRAPGETPGTFALESAMDELAVALKMDPVALRLANHADLHPENQKAGGKQHLKECYEMGKEKFRLDEAIGRTAQHEAHRRPTDRLGNGHRDVPGYQFPGTARIRLMSDGAAGFEPSAPAPRTTWHRRVHGLHADPAGAVGLPVEKVKFELGDSALAGAPVCRGLLQPPGVGQALSVAADALKAALLKLATDGNASSKLSGVKPSEAVFREQLMAQDDSSRSESLASLSLARIELTLKASVHRPARRASSTPPPTRLKVRTTRPIKGSMRFSRSARTSSK